MFAEGGEGRYGVQGAGGINKEVMDRLAAFERKLNIQNARTGIEAEMRRAQAHINQDKNPGLFVQMNIAYTIYSAPEIWKEIIALMGGLSAVLKVPTSKLAFLRDELVSTGLQKCREAGENLTDEQVASIENAVLETDRANARQRSSWPAIRTGSRKGKCYDCAWLSLTALSTVTRNLWL
jgi:hypothetical protein